MERHRVDFESMAWERPAVGVRYKAYEKDGKKKVEITHQPREWRLVQVEVYASPEKGVYA